MMTSEKIVQKLMEHLRWYIREDETHTSDPANTYFAKGKENAQALLDAIEKKDYRAALLIPTADQIASSDDCPHKIPEANFRYLFEVDYFYDLQRRGLTQDFPGTALWASHDRYSDLNIEQHAERPFWGTHVYFCNGVA